MKELKEEWTYPEVMQALAVLDMQQDINLAVDDYDERELKRREDAAKGH